MLRQYTVDEAQSTILRREDTFLFDQDAMSEDERARAIALYGEPLTADQGVQRILQDVRTRGDTAVRDWTAKLDGHINHQIHVPKSEISAAHATVDADLLAALRTAAARIADFHARQPLPNWSTGEMGGRLGQRVTPIRRVGIYVPGGSAPLPSTLLMCAIPARVAGVNELVVVTPRMAGCG